MVFEPDDYYELFNSGDSQVDDGFEGDFSDIFDDSGIEFDEDGDISLWE